MTMVRCRLTVSSYDFKLVTVIQVKRDVPEDTCGPAEYGFLSVFLALSLCPKQADLG